MLRTSRQSGTSGRQAYRCTSMIPRSHVQAWVRPCHHVPTIAEKPAASCLNYTASSRRRVAAAVAAEAAATPTRGHASSSK